MNVAATDPSVGVLHVSNGILEQIFKSVRCFEASFGLQPFKVVSVGESHVKWKLLKLLTLEDKELLEDGALVVCAVRPSISRSLIRQFFIRLSEEKKTSCDAYARYRNMLETSINKIGKDGRTWPERQALGAMEILATCARKVGVQTKQLNMVEKDQVDQILHFKSGGFTTSMVHGLRFREPGKLRIANRSREVASLIY